MSVIGKLRGTIETLFQIGKGGPNIKNNSGVIEGRNAADNAYAILRGATPSGANDLTPRGYLDLLFTPAISAPSSNVTLTSSSNKKQVMTPSADIIVTLPKTGVLAGEEWVVKNDGYKVITLKSNNTNILGYIHKDGKATFVSKINEPDTKSNWSVDIYNKTKRYTLTYNGGTGTLQDNGTYGIVTPSATVAAEVTSYITLTVDPMNNWFANYTHSTEFSPAIGAGAGANIAVNGSFSFLSYVSGTDIYIFDTALDSGWAGVGGAIYLYHDSGGTANSQTSMSGPISAKPTWAD